MRDSFFFLSLLSLSLSLYSLINLTHYLSLSLVSLMVIKYSFHQLKKWSIEIFQVPPPPQDNALRLFK